MSKSIPALINPDMLVWARKTARLTLEDAAQKAGVSTEKLSACEAGEVMLTFSQLMKIAGVYKRPVSLFYLKEPPSGWAPIQDFRRLTDVAPGFSSRLTYAIRQARERREVAVELRSELDEPIQAFEFTAAIHDDVERTGAAIRAYLGVTELHQLEWKRKAFEGWRAAVEAKDVLVFVVPRLDLSEMRGTAIAEREFPIILVNGQDRTGGRVFTLLHEFCHLAVRQSGVSGSGGEEDDAPNPAVERFCNRVAAAALMPNDLLLDLPLVRQKRDKKTWEMEELEALSLRFGVSKEAMLLRLLSLGKTTSEFYRKMRPLFLAEYAALTDQQSSGGPPHHVQVMSQLGRNFTQLILEGYHERRLTMRDVANYFNMQVKNIPAIDKAAFGTKG